jgi:LmbE family N-acetylglucosaminyl deacetylase
VLVPEVPVNFEDAAVLAVGAHPDDIEFMMSGTLALLHRAGLAVHMWNLANGSCGTATHAKDEIVRLRWQEAQDSAGELSAVMHRPLVDDLAIYYEPALLAQVAAVVRQVRPAILLVPSPEDYMEDHSNTSRLLVTAAFVRGMRHFATSPATEPWGGDVVIYHALPYGLRQGLRRRVRAGQYVDVKSVLDTKRAMLARHTSQKEWLDVSQGLDAYLRTMEDMCLQVGRMSGRFELAEGWRRHLHLGLSSQEDDPLSQILRQNCWTDSRYEDALDL